MKNAQEEGEEIDAKGSYATIFDGIECVCVCVCVFIAFVPGIVVHKRKNQPNMIWSIPGSISSLLVVS
jgi:hypothetical protein